MILAGARTVRPRPWRAPPRSGRSPRRSATRRARAGRPRRPPAPPRPRSADASDRSAPRSTLRRWANAASTTAKTCSRVAVVAGGSRRVQATRPGVDVGRRPEDVAADRAGPAHVGVPGGLDRRDAVHLGAGCGRQPVGDLGLHHHQPVLQRRAAAPAGAAAPAPRRCRAGWRPGRSAAGRARRRCAARRRARPRTGRPGRARTPRSWRAAASASTSSTSIATTRPATSSRARVSEPRPGPTSSTTSSVGDRRTRGRSGARCWRR